MKKNILIFTLSIIFTFGYLIEGYSFSFPSDSRRSEALKGNPSILIVERDVPQTRVDFEPVINHQALIANLSDKTIEMDIESPIPKSLYIIKKFYPTFGQESVLAMPMYYPQKIKISNYKILERPSIEKRNEEIVFRWANVSIPPGQAVIASYENYFGNLSQFYTKEGLRVLELHVHTSYGVSLKDGGKKVIFNLNYNLENKGENDVEDLLMDVILPDVVYPEGEKSEIKLFDTIETTASSQVKFHRGMLGDGFGKAATGTIFTANIPKIKPGELNKLWMNVEGKKGANRGECYPLFTFQFRMKGPPIWPRTILKSKKKLEIEKFYYRQANLVIPDSKLFRFGPQRIEVIPLK